MRKLLLMLAVVTVVSFTFTSCKSDKKEDVKTDVASNEIYQCPMDCEDGKSYTEAGSCPVCKMDLKSKSVDMDDDSHKKEKVKCTCKYDESECVCEKDECTCEEDFKKDQLKKDKTTENKS